MSFRLWSPKLRLWLCSAVKSLCLTPWRALCRVTDCFMQMKHNILFQKKLRDAKSSELLSLVGEATTLPRLPALATGKKFFFDIQWKRRIEFCCSAFFPGFLPFSIPAYFNLFLFVRVSNAAFAQYRMLSCCSEHPFFRFVFLANGWNLSSAAGGRHVLRCTSHTREKVGSCFVSSDNEMFFETGQERHWLANVQ